MQIAIAQTDAEIAACFPVMSELRPHLVQGDFVARIRLQERENFRLAYGAVDGAVRCVTGFRLVENLAIGRVLYVDDLVSGAAFRSHGHGRDMLNWLRAYAKEQKCLALHLDSGVKRLDAHRFYKREGLDIIWHHFGIDIPQ